PPYAREGRLLADPALAQHVRRPWRPDPRDRLHWLHDEGRSAQCAASRLPEPRAQAGRSPGAGEGGSAVEPSTGSGAGLPRLSRHATDRSAASLRHASSQAAVIAEFGCGVGPAVVPMEEE